METDETSGLGRRDLLRVGAGTTTAAAVATGGATRSSAQQEFDYGGWFQDVPNFESTADMTGQSEVRVTVGPGGDLVFDPPAIHVDPGTTVVWEWSEGFHNVAEKQPEERYACEVVGESDTTYTVTFESDGISQYVCEPHRGQGMKGAVAVGSGEGTPEISEGELQTGGGGGAGGEGAGGGGGGDGGTGGAGGGGVGDEVALFGVAGVLALLSPAALVVLLYRLGRREDERQRAGR